MMETKFGFPLNMMLESYHRKMKSQYFRVKILEKLRNYIQEYASGGRWGEGNPGFGGYKLSEALKIC